MAAARRLLVIGAGPIGIAAALGGSRLGWNVTVLEQGAHTARDPEDRYQNAVDSGLALIERRGGPQSVTA